MAGNVRVTLCGLQGKSRFPIVHVDHWAGHRANYGLVVCPDCLAASRGETTIRTIVTDSGTTLYVRTQETHP